MLIDFFINKFNALNMGLPLMVVQRHQLVQNA